MQKSTIKVNTRYGRHIDTQVIDHYIDDENGFDTVAYDELGINCVVRATSVERAKAVAFKNWGIPIVKKHAAFVTLQNPMPRRD